MPYNATPEDVICQRETTDEIMTVLAHCTDTQRERFLLYALYDLSYAEVAALCGCSKGAVEKSITEVKNIFQKFWKAELAEIDENFVRTNLSHRELGDLLLHRKETL